MIINVVIFNSLGYTLLIIWLGHLNFIFVVVNLCIFFALIVNENVNVFDWIKDYKVSYFFV